MESEPMDGVFAGGGDATLGHILSFVPAAEAARAAALSQPWRHVFAALHTLSFIETTRPVPDDYDSDDRWMNWSPGWNSTVFSDDHSKPKPVPSQPFVNAALHGRHRGALTAAAPLRGLHVAFDAFDATDAAASATAVDGWLSYAAHHAATAVEFRLGHAPLCARAYALRPAGEPAGAADHHLPSDIEVDYDEDATAAVPPPVCGRYAVPSTLFSGIGAAALRRLRLGSCRLDLPTTIALPWLDTLHLTRVTDRRNAAHVQRLVAGCPRLADLTLEACDAVVRLSLLDKRRLRRLALRCCHNLATVAADSSELRVFKYGGAVPGPSFLTLRGPCRVSSCTLNFCGEEVTDRKELDKIRSFLDLFAGGVTKLHLKSARLGSGIGYEILSSKLEFPALHNLELTGMLPEDDITTVSAVTRILQRTPSLKTLSLFFLPEPEVPDHECWYEESLRAAHKLGYSQYMKVTMPDCDEIPCLRARVREINLVHYQGGTAQRMLAMLLLRKAPVVDELYCEFARGRCSSRPNLWRRSKGGCLISLPT